MITRQIKESPLAQGEDEQIAYSLTTTPWGSTPTSVAITMKSVPGLSSLGTANLTGSASVNGDVITTPVVHGLTAGAQYRMEIKFTSAGNIFEAWALINGEE